MKDNSRVRSIRRTCWKCHCSWIGCAIENICPNCNECNELVDHHTAMECTGNHSPERRAKSVDFRVADFVFDLKSVFKIGHPDWIIE